MGISSKIVDQLIENGCYVPNSWNDTYVSYPLHKTLHQHFEAQVIKSPDAVALFFNNRKITYNELNCLANQLAHRLQTEGITTESLVGVLFQRSFEMVIALLAVLKCGGAYVPIDPELPEERRSFMIKDSNIQLILAHDKTLEKVPENSKVIIYNLEDPSFASYSNSNIDSNTCADNAAYVIYTSGSTGTPKGVINTHAGIVNRLLWMQDYFSLTHDDRVLQKTPYSFDVSVWEFFWPLITGAQLVIAQPGGHRDPDYLIDTINQNSITTIHFVPSMLRLFLDANKIKSITSLKRVICSGEALPYKLQQLFFESFSCDLYNLYGPTEAAVDVTYWKCRRDDEREIVPIGKPISNIQIYILDESMKQVTVGTAGELYIGGIGVARGYLNRPELTKEKFIANPFSNNKNSKLYKTGDLCRYLNDGAIDYLSRIDDQVKMHGFRIELGEIEAAILSFNSVCATSVISQKNTISDDVRLIAYVVTDLDSIPTNELRTHLLKTLPEYMIPSQFVKIDKMPISHNGKIDKKALPVPQRKRPHLHQAYIKPITETELFISSIWENHLNVDMVGLDDNFFDIGGNSILAAIISNFLEKHYKTPFSPTLLFQYPTVRTFSLHITQNQENSNSEMENLHHRAITQKNMIKNLKWLKK